MQLATLAIQAMQGQHHEKYIQKYIQDTGEKKHVGFGFPIHTYWRVLQTLKGANCTSTVQCKTHISHRNHRRVLFLKWGVKISETKTQKTSNLCQYTQPPVSPTAVLLVTMLVSWPGRQYDEVSREVIPICSSDYFANSHLILPTTHQQGARERTCGSCSHKEGGLGEEGAGEEIMRFGFFFRSKKQEWGDKKKK